MTYRQILLSSWIYSEASRNWFAPSEKPRFIHHFVFNIFKSNNPQHIITVNGIDDVRCIYQSLSERLPDDCKPNGAFTTVHCLRKQDGSYYYVFTDVEQLY